MTGPAAGRAPASGAAGCAAVPGWAAVTAGMPLVRRALPGDRDELTRMFGRCTPLTRYRRFHAPVTAIPARYLAGAVAGGPFHHALVACPGPDPGPLSALASCCVVDEGAAELGLLVEDAWQGRGLGRRLVGELVAQASRDGLRLLTAQVLSEQAWLAGLLGHYGPARLRAAGTGVLTVAVRLPDTRPAA